MRKRVFLPLILLCLVAPWPRTIAGPAATSAAPLPAGLEVPAGQVPALVLAARGVQIYECRPVSGQPGKFEWVFIAPEADLFDAEGQKVGRHYAGPTWELKDGDKVVGRLKAKADAPDGKGIPWLLLEAASSNGGGIMGSVASIQRVDTVGGKPPATGAVPSAAGHQVRVPYAATYKFYIAKPDSSSQ